MQPKRPQKSCKQTPKNTYPYRPSKTIPKTSQPNPSTKIRLAITAALKTKSTTTAVILLSRKNSKAAVVNRLSRYIWEMVVAEIMVEAMVKDILENSVNGLVVLSFENVSGSLGYKSRSLPNGVETNR